MREKQNEKLKAKLDRQLKKLYGEGKIDLNVTKDLEHVLKYAVAAFRDFDEYYGILCELEGDFDESLEHFDTQSWYGLFIPEYKCDRLYLECIDALETATMKLDMLTERSKEQLSLIMKVILTSNEAVQEEILGCAANVGPVGIDAWLEEFFNMYLETDDYEYDYHIEKNYEAFLKAIKDKLALDNDEQKEGNNHE